MAALQYFKSLIFLLIFLTLSSSSMAWSWFSSSGNNPAQQQTLQLSADANAEFSMEALNDEKGIERLNKARRLILAGTKSCWHDAYQGIFAACSEITTDDNDKRKRFAWDLSNCFQKDSGRPLFPKCPLGSTMKPCLEKLDNDDIHTYREFYLETNSICHQIQSDMFRHQTEKLVNDLVKSSDYAEEKLDVIAEVSEKLLKGSKYVQDSLASIDEQAQQIAEASKNVSDQIGGIMKQQELVFEHSQKIAASQLELQMGQNKMMENLEEGMATVQESYRVLGQELHSLKDETIEIEKTIGVVGEAMASKMSKLQSKADDIGNVAEISLERQKELLNGQSEALDGLQSLTDFQSQALEESRLILQNVASFGLEQQEKLLRQEEQIEKVHKHIITHSKSILAAQEAFKQKQASMFVALDRLFALHNALLLESRAIKAFIVYALSMFVLCMLTSTKSTQPVRLNLYICLWIAFVLEIAVHRYATNAIENPTWMINTVRIGYLVYAVYQIVRAVYIFRDIPIEIFHKLRDLTEEVTCLQKTVASLILGPDDEIDWITFVDEDIPDDAENIKDDHEYFPFGQANNCLEYVQQEVGDNLNAIVHAGRYNLRSRSRHSTVRS